MRRKQSRIANLLASLAAVAVFAAPLAAQEPAAERFAGVRAYIEEAMEEHDVPSVAVGVAHRGETVWAEAFGWADIDRRIPATTDTRRHDHIVRLDLRLRDGRLGGSATAIAGDGGWYFALSSYTELERDIAGR